MYIITTLECFLPMAVPIVKYEVNTIMNLNIDHEKDAKGFYTYSLKMRKILHLLIDQDYP